jgi:hypothetical protein
MIAIQCLLKLTHRCSIILGIVIKYNDSHGVGIGGIPLTIGMICFVQ